MMAVRKKIGSRFITSRGTWNFHMMVPAMILISVVSLSSVSEGASVTVGSPLRVTEVATPEIGTPLNLAPEAYSNLRWHESVRLSEFPLSKTERVDLELERFHVTTPATRIVAGTERGEIPIALPEITLYRGTVAGEPESRVVLSISPRGIQGVIQTALENYAFSPKRFTAGMGESSDHVIYRGSELRTLVPPDKPERSVNDILLTVPVAEGPVQPALPGSFQVCRMALECDYEFWLRFNDYGKALDYIYTLFGVIGEIYERDVSSKIALTYIRIWTTVNDPYSYVGGDVTGLEEFINYWRQNHNPGKAQFIERDVAHLLSSRGVGAWGNVGVLCDYDKGFSISGGIALLPTLAEKLLHDVAYAGHEIGHNFNGEHTHCLIDPSTNDYVDKCVTENRSGCNQTQDCSTAPSSIMSYCKDCPGGLNNILQQFDVPNITRIRNHVNSSCLRVARDPSYVDWRNTGTELGTPVYPYNTVKEGTEAVFPGGTVSIASGNYSEPMTIWQPMTLSATGGTVVIGQ